MTRKARPKVAVSLRALIGRINRKLRSDDEVLKITRGGRAQIDLGDFYTLDVRQNFVIERDVDPESFGRKLGVLQQWEELVAEVEEAGRARLRGPASKTEFERGVGREPLATSARKGLLDRARKARARREG
jgi:hypothetical protein